MNQQTGNTIKCLQTQIDTLKDAFSQFKQFMEPARTEAQSGVFDEFKIERVNVNRPGDNGGS